MDPDDERSKLVFAYMDAVAVVRPQVFVMENVKALASLAKFAPVRDALFERARLMDYRLRLVVVNSSDFGVSQSRERMFLFGFRGCEPVLPVEDALGRFRAQPESVGTIIRALGRAGTAMNGRVVSARVVFAKNPVLRQSPYAGMLFNGQGRPVNPHGVAATLPATMGGNRTPVVDEALRIQTFPDDYIFTGRQSSVMKQIGNAVPPRLGLAIGQAASHCGGGCR